jgi:hypothetical protein
LSVILIAVIAICILQYNWFNKVLKSKDDQIRRMDEKERQIFEKLLACIDKKN